MTVRVLIRKKPDRDDLQLYYVHPLTRREVTKSAATSDKGQAERAASRWEEELAAHFGVGGDGWQHFRDRFRREFLAVLARKTFLSYNTALNQFQRVMEPASVATIDATAVSLFQSRLLNEQRPLSSIANYLTHLRSALNWAEQMGITRRAPMVKIPRQAKRTFMRGRPVTEPEYRKMLKACPGPEWRRFLEMLWLSGMRLAEGIIASWDEPPIMADMDAKPHPQFLFYAEGQKARRDDAVPIAPDFAAWLSKTPRKQRHGRISPLRLKTESRISEAISAIGAAAGIIVNSDDKPASAQDLRRAFGTRWAPYVMPITLQRMMRHADISTTMKYYVNLSSADVGRELWSVPNQVPKQRSTRGRTSRQHRKNSGKNDTRKSR